MSRWLCLGIVLSASSGLIGCDKKDNGRYDLKGKITFDGKPIPMGHLRFAPDKKQGNSGPGTYATISNGEYKTPPNQGTVGGPHKVFIFGTDGVEFTNNYGNVTPIGRPLFPEYEISMDLPKESATQDFQVPADPSDRRKKKAKR